MTRLSVHVVAFCALLAAGPVVADAPFVDPADDAKHFGPPDQILFWTPQQKVAGFRNSDRLFWTRPVRAGGSMLELPYAKQDIGAVKISLDGVSITVDEYFERKNVAGLLVIKDGKIVYERYGLGNSAESRWISFSVAKSVVSMLIGAAIQDGYINSADEKVTTYLPRLKNSAYDQASIRDLLQMASGVQWNEDYADPESDVASASWETVELYEYLRHKPRAAEPGQRFNYNTAETNLAGTLLRSAVGNNLATYLSEKIWRPFGMEHDASWNLTEPGGGEFGGCCINATLRDYGRIGLFALANGRLADGTEVLPSGWMRESLTPSQGYDGYGYFWWLQGAGVFQAQGIFGQRIYINPGENLVIAMHSAWQAASADTDKAWQRAMTAAVTNALSGGRQLSQQECLASPDHTLIQPSADAPYQCVPARNHCEAGFVQDEHGAEDCEAKAGCQHDPGHCFCPAGVQCICGGGPPQSCKLAESE